MYNFAVRRCEINFSKLDCRETTAVARSNFHLLEFRDVRFILRFSAPNEFFIFHFFSPPFRQIGGGRGETHTSLKNVTSPSRFSSAIFFPQRNLIGHRVFFFFAKLSTLFRGAREGSYWHSSVAVERNRVVCVLSPEGGRERERRVVDDPPLA